MITFKDLAVLSVVGILAAILGVYLTGYTAAFVLPKSMISVAWFWNIFVVLFLGYGVISGILAYVAVKFLRSNAIVTVLGALVVSQLVLVFYLGHYSFYLSNILVMLGGLFLGAYLAKAQNA